MKENNSHQTADNGLNINSIEEAQNAITSSGNTAKFTWRAECEWMNGLHVHTTMKGFFGLNKEQTHKIPYSIHSDYPGCFASEDNGATPAEIMLAALISCLSANVASVAQKRDIQLRAMTAYVEGDMNIYGVPGIKDDAKNSFEAIRVRFDIDSDASRIEIEDVVLQSRKHSVVFALIANPGNLSVIVE